MKSLKFNSEKNKYIKFAKRNQWPHQQCSAKYLLNSFFYVLFFIIEMTMRRNKIAMTHACNVPIIFIICWVIYLYSIYAHCRWVYSTIFIKCHMTCPKDFVIDRFYFTFCVKVCRLLLFPLGWALQLYMNMQVQYMKINKRNIINELESILERCCRIIFFPVSGHCAVHFLLLSCTT